MAEDQDFISFVRDHIRSVWAVELLLALRRDPSKGWDIDELVRDLRASTTLVRINLERFERSGLAVCDAAGCYRFAPANAVLEELCGRLEAAYRERPVAVINLIAKPDADPVQSLADAFKWGKPK